MTGHSFAELRNQYTEDEGYPEVDPDYFKALLEGAIEAAPAIDELLAQWLDRPVNQLDPVEHAVLLIGVEELRAHLDVPYRVVLNEGVELAKKFGATDGHKFINAILDRAARQLRAAELQALARQTPAT
jgi:N utilization substance protein B